MRKIQVLGVALLALFAFGALTAVSASAANTYLLAEWLLNGVAIGASETNLVEIDGTLLTGRHQSCPWFSCRDKVYRVFRRLGWAEFVRVYQ